MLLAHGKTYLCAAGSIGSLVFVCLTAGCQSTKPATAAAPATTAAAVQLSPYTASDQSASAGVPAGWQVTNASGTLIQMSGPQGVAVVLGSTLVAQNAAFQLAQKGANGVDLSMPYSATLAQKLTMMMEHSSAAAGKPAPQLTISSSTQLPLPATVGQCGRFVADMTTPQGAMKVLAVFCSLPLDSGGRYKNIMLLAQAPTAVAAQQLPTVQAIFQSYRIPSAWLQKKLAPFTAPPPPVMSGAAGAAAINRQTALMTAGSLNSANCFDLSVLRETPQALLPRSCGGLRPD
ncbi:MAG TPA: hypothetical protein VGN01_19725 [Acidobacteriaceae bacterium]